MGCCKEAENNLFSMSVIAQRLKTVNSSKSDGTSSTVRVCVGSYWISVVGGLQEQLENILWQ